MTPLFPDLPRPLGAYTLTRLLAVREESDVYAASQGSVGREVALEVLHRGAKPEQQAAFLLTARARVAAADLPNVGQVYETLCADGLWFLTQELPAGEPLGARAAGAPLSVAEVARIIEAAATLYARCEASGHATLPLTAENIFFSAAGEVHFLSPIIGRAAERITDAVRMRALAAAVEPLVAPGVPGATRFASVLQWLREGYEGSLLTWEQIRATAETLRRQLGDDGKAAKQEQPSEAGLKRRQRRRIRHMVTWALTALGCAAVITAIGSLGFLFRTPTTVPLPAVHAEGVTCRQADGQLVLVHRAAVSVAEYAAFLKAWDKAPAALQESCRLGIPAAAGIIPAGWEEQLRRKKPAEPVTGITAWQAELYARFYGGMLPDAASLQCAREALGPGGVDEWAGDFFTGDTCGLLPERAPLAIRPEAPYAPLPLPDKDYAAETLGFRIMTPLTTPE